MGEKICLGGGWKRSEEISTLYSYIFFFLRLSGYLLVSFPWWCEFHFTVRFVLLCYVPGWATLSLSFFFFSPSVSEVEGLKGTAAVSGNWKSCLLIPPQHWNTQSGVTYSRAHTCSHTTWSCTKKGANKYTHTHTKQKGLVPAETHPGRTNSNKRIKRTNMHAQIATRTIWLWKEAVDLDALWLENQNTFTEY